MQLRPLLIKIRLKLKALAVKYRPHMRPLSVNAFYRHHWNGPEPNCNDFTGGTKRNFFFNLNERDKYVSALSKRFPEYSNKLITEAEKLLNHSFDLLGSGEVGLGKEINWHQDFKSGFEWPKVHYSKVKAVDLSNSADVKVPWELSRLQYVTTLGRAFWLSGDSRYRNEFVRTIECWEQQNPVDFGINWCCSMEIAIRAINIIWGTYHFAFDSNLSDEFVKKTIRLLYYHALHIEKNLETIESGSNTNHLLANYLGLFYVGLLFPEFDRSTHWLKLGRTGLEREILLQVNEDGADYECSLSYHRLVLEMFLSAYILGDRNDLEFSQEYRERLVNMLKFSAVMTGPSGKVSAIGDNDDGYIVKLGENDPQDHRALLDIGAQIFLVEVPSCVTAFPGRLWYLGPDSLSRWPNMARRKPALFKKSGYAVIQSDRFHLTFNACGITEKGFGGHKHNDLLSVNLEIDSNPFLIDTGTACYTSDVRLRNINRSTASHNTIVLDDEEQNRFLRKALFYMFKDAQPRIDLWTVAKDRVIVSGKHDGYYRHGDNVVHRRTIEASLDELTVDINDQVSGQGEHLIRCSYLTPFECETDKSGSAVLISASEAQTLRLSFDSPSQIILKTVPFDYYPRYGVTKGGWQIVCTSRSQLPFKLSTKMTYREINVSGYRLSPTLSLKMKRPELQDNL